ncbi:hypothetical protein [Comamonas aquatica]|uniref:hypothetical protein n=1 Tax=Comamonas aquatica TaxID=225991 RepID=UPI00244A107A|nr:hypothetical protein [Comamonas aquatica]MDH1445589.1 hypothetical protein [Comamonas aquatica]
MDKLPRTQGGGAGSFVRGNEFAKNRPTVYSHTKRGQDTINVDPYGINVVRKADGPRETLPLELIFGLRFTPQQRDWMAAYPGGIPLTPQQRGAAGCNVRRYYGLSLSTSDKKDETVEPQQEVWQYPLGTIVNGYFVSVGDGYFVALGHPARVSTVYENFDDQDAGMTRPRVALIHRDNLDGPYLNTITRTKHREGNTLRFHRGEDASADRGFADKRSDILRDVRGANYYLQECEDLMQRVENLEAVVHNMGPKVSVVPLGWVDSTRRYAFAVYGLSTRDRGELKVNCYVYCTGTRALLHDTTVIPKFPGSQPEPWPWVGLAESCSYFPTMAALGRGKMAVVMIPHTYAVAVAGLGHGITEGLTTHRVGPGYDPVLIYSTDFGQSWQRRPLPELRPLARPHVSGGYFYPPLKVQITPITEAGEFIMGVAALNDVLSGDVPSALFDEIYERLLAENYWANGGPTTSGAWWSAGIPERSSYLTLFRGSLFGGLSRMTGLDDLAIRFDDWPQIYQGHNKEMMPPGTYRMNILLNGTNSAVNPYLVALGHNRAALFVRTYEIMIPPYPGHAVEGQHIKYTEIETFVMETADGGGTWTKRVLPPEFFDFSDYAAYSAQAVAELAVLDGLTELRRETLMTAARNRAPCLPGRNHISICVISPWAEPGSDGLPASLPEVVVMSHQMDSTQLLVSRYRKEIVDGVPRNPWTMKRLLSLPTEAVPQVASDYIAWEFGRSRPPTGLAYLGDEDSDTYPAVLNPALPKLFEA